MKECENRSYDMDIELNENQRVGFSIVFHNIEKEVAEKFVRECEDMTKRIKETLAE